MELDIKELEKITDTIANTQQGEDQAEDLYNKMGLLNEYVQKQLRLYIVIKQ